MIVCGSRSWTDKREIMEALIWNALPGHTTVIHGGARGADALGGEAAAALGIRTEVYPPEWGRHGVAAGHIRNDHMLSMMTPKDLVLIFWDGVSPGTKGMIEKCRARSIPFVLTKLDGPEDDDTLRLFSA